MERLTTRREDGSVETTGKSYSEIHMSYVDCTRVNDRYDIRLAEYEDIGLTPEEIKLFLHDRGIGLAIRSREAREESVRLKNRLQQAEADNAALILELEALKHRTAPQSKGGLVNAN